MRKLDVIVGNNTTTKPERLLNAFFAQQQLSNILE